MAQLIKILPTGLKSKINTTNEKQKLEDPEMHFSTSRFFSLDFNFKFLISKF